MFLSGLEPKRRVIRLVGADGGLGFHPAHEVLHLEQATEAVCSRIEFPTRFQDSADLGERALAAGHIVEHMIGDHSAEQPVDSGACSQVARISVLLVYLAESVCRVLGHEADDLTGMFQVTVPPLVA